MTYLILKNVLQAHQEVLYLAKIFLNVLDMLDHLQSHTGAVEATETTVSNLQLIKVAPKLKLKLWIYIAPFQ